MDAAKELSRHRRSSIPASINPCVYMCVCAYVFVYVRMYACIDACIHRHMYIYIHICVHMYAYVCMHTYMYICARLKSFPATGSPSPPCWSSVSTSSHTWPRIVGEAAALPQPPRRHEECGSTKPAPLAEGLSLHSSHSMLHSIDSCCGRRMTLVPVETIKGVVGSST